MNATETADLLCRILYKHNGGFSVMTGAKYGGNILIQHWQEQPNCKTGMLEVQRGRKWYISPHMTPSEVVQTALLAVLTFEEHEVRENFLFDGKRVFGPHIDVAALAEVADREQVRA